MLSILSLTIDICHLNGFLFRILLKSSLLYLKVALNKARIKNMKLLLFTKLQDIVGVATFKVSTYVAIGDKVVQRMILVELIHKIL